MTNWGINKRILSLAITPTILVAILMSAFFINSYFQNSDRSLEQRGKTIATHLAIASEYDLVSANLTNLAATSKAARDNDKDLLTIVFYDKNQRIIASNGSAETIAQMAIDDPISLSQLENNAQLFRLTQEKNTSHGKVFYAPIISNLSNQTDPWASNTQQTPNNTVLLGYVAVLFTDEFTTIGKYKAVFTSLFISIMGMIIATFLARRMALSVTQPVTGMVKGVNRIKEGHLNTRLNTHASAELKTLELGINAMAENMEHNQEELQLAVEQATSDLQISLESLEVNNLELDLARKQALEASRVKTEFLANMGHEIRTPMNGVIGFTDLLLKTKLTNKQKDFLFDIKRSATNLLSIIEDILDYSKIEAGKMSLERYPFDLRECVDDVFSMLGPNANSKGLELVSLIYSDVPKSLLGDPIRIKQIITNLIGNAIKFTTSGSVELHAEVESESNDGLLLKIQVKDTGIGISQEQQDHLFKAFNQADASTKRIFGGTGLGLVISKSLVEKMGGEISVASNQDHGSNFWFTIQCEPSETKPESDITSELLANKSALVFDPHPATRLSITQMLEDMRMAVSSFEQLEDLASEIDLYSQSGKSIELIVIGGQSLKRRQQQLEFVCNQAATLNCPVLSFSTSPNADALEQLQQLGVTRTLRKPVTHRNLYNALLDLVRHGDASEQSSNDEQEIHLIENSYVLAVDDNPANLRLVSILLEELGMKVDTAENGIQAISLSKDKVYDAIFMDIQMPEMDGLEATRTIRANQTNEKTPIIALTAHAMANEREQLLEAGMDDYLTKPVSEQDLMNTLLKWLHPSKEPINNDIFEPNQTDEELTLDWALSLKLANNNADLAAEMLKMFVDSNFETSQQIHGAYQAQEFESLLHHVHKLHGASCYLGTPKLKRLSSQYETKLKQEKYNQLEEVHKNLLSELKQITEAAELYLPEAQSH